MLEIIIIYNNLIYEGIIERMNEYNYLLFSIIAILG